MKKIITSKPSQAIRVTSYLAVIFGLKYKSNLNGKVDSNSSRAWKRWTMGGRS